MNIVWSPASKDEYAELLSYIESELGLEAALKFLDKTEMVIKTIETFPLSFPTSEVKPEIRKAVITKQTSLLYRIHKNNIQLLHFWDNRRGSNLY
ncbi:MAG: type II toxin-antitoxin system RelE/ParE family toxin [Bacteroidota bacterium]